MSKNYDDCPFCGNIVQFNSEERLQFACGTTISRLTTRPKTSQTDTCRENCQDVESPDLRKRTLRSRLVSYSSQFC